MKINGAQDDAAGYAISERMRVQIRSLDQANQNTQNGSSMMKTAEGAVSSTVEILKALKEKAISAANDSNTDDDRRIIQKEMDQFIDQIDDNALVTFNGKYLVDGSKNYRSEYGTVAAFTNQSLATDTLGTDALTSLMNRNRESLEIQSTDRITASFVKDGRTYTTTFKVGSNTINDIFKNMVKEYAFKSNPSEYSEQANSSEIDDPGYGSEGYNVFGVSVNSEDATGTDGITFTSNTHNYEETLLEGEHGMSDEGNSFVYSGIRGQDCRQNLGLDGSFRRRRLRL